MFRMVILKAWGGLQIVQHVVKDIPQNFRGLISLNPISLTIGNLNTKWKIWVKQKIHLIGIFFFLNIFLETWKLLPFIIFLLYQQNTSCYWLGFLSPAQCSHIIWMDPKGPRTHMHTQLLKCCDV